MAKKLIIVDISSFIFRAFFAIRPLHAPDGTPVNSVYGVLHMMIKLLQEYQPTHFVLARDLKGGSFRNEIYPEYKANRGAPPDELVPQFAIIEELIEKLNFPAIAIKNYEADDIIGSLAVQFKKDFDEILIASSDKDLMQFIDGPIKMLDTRKDIAYGRDEVYEKMGVYPEQIMDYLSLLGDSSDNIPGVKGIGAKGASKLLGEYGDLDTVFKNIENISNKRAKTALENDGDSAFLSKQLVEIKTDLELGYTADELAYSVNPTKELYEFFLKLGFKSAHKKFELFEGAPSEYVRENLEVEYDKLDSTSDWQRALKEIKRNKFVGIELFFDQDDYHFANILYASFSTGKKTFLIYFGENLKSRKCFKDLIDLDEEIIFTSSNIKPILCFLIANDLNPYINYMDLSQAHFVINPANKHDLDTMSMEYLDESVSELKEFKKDSFVEDEDLEKKLAKRAFSSASLYKELNQSLKKSKMQKLFSDIDNPLIEILAEMEMNGINLDVKYYNELADEFSSQLTKIQKKVDKLGGKDVNLKSPKQVSVLLFEKLELPIIKKTKTGASTDSSVLQALDGMGESEVPGLILKYRELDKLMSTYVSTLPKLLQSKTKKIHTHFLQNNAATGRLSSELPNLQNIPTRTENGRLLRKGFSASKGKVLLTADYSQVELRILAHFSEDKTMVNSFKKELDIHAQTASEVFGVAIEDVTRDQRSSAKAINFGLMYGQSSFGLSQQLKISQRDAKSYITEYFTKFSKVKSYLDSLKEICEEKGYSETMMGRKRQIPDINSTNRQVKSAAERMAINSPIQGTAADIIKLAMLRIHDEMYEKQTESKMLLQVHDELIFEVPKKEIKLMEELVRRNMENIVKLKVPLTVEMATGTNWYDLK